MNKESRDSQASTGHLCRERQQAAVLAGYEVQSNERISLMHNLNLLEGASKLLEIENLSF